jgi:predicted nucleotidyltransferase
MITQIFNQNIIKILTLFSISPGSRFLRNEIKEKTKLNNATLDDSLNILLNAGIIKKDKRLLSLNLEYKEIIYLIKKEHQKLNELYTEAYFPILEVLSFLSFKKGLKAYLFGSYAKLIHNENSDIDIAVVSNKFNQKQKDKLNKIISKIEKKYKKNIEIHYFTGEFYKNKRDSLVKDILRNGRQLI